jgi:O-antigen ligase
MAKKKRNPARSGSGPISAPTLGASDTMATAGANSQAVPAGTTGNARATPAPARIRILSLPLEITKGDWTVFLMTLMMFFAPAMGVPNEEMLQDTLKSIIVSGFSLVAALVFFWRQRNRRDAVRWHAIMWIPLAWMAYALGSMVWSHTYLGGVEAIRWFIFSVITWLTLNTLSRDRFPMLAWGIHAGALIAALWGALQFWFDFKFFPQGPNPASTFVNRNFLAEYLVVTLPFTAYLLVQARRSAVVAFLAATLAFNMVVIMMTGTRSALLAMMILSVLLPFGAFVFRKQFAFVKWPSGTRILAIGVFLASFIGLGLIHSDNTLVSGEPGINKTPLYIAVYRAGRAATPYEYTEGSFSVRLVMWKATGRIIERRPLTGVGAGAWEVDLPLFQNAGSQLETDYYVHNEILQLLAEYGLVGWITLAALLAYLSVAGWRTWKLRGGPQAQEGALRAFVLVAMLAFLIVSNAGFPWRMAATCALFALMLGTLAASDARLAFAGRTASRRLAWQPAYSQTAAVASMVAVALAAFISQQAAECESKIVKSVKIALTISQSGDVNNPKWDKPKAEMLRLISEGVAINPHYRKITPMVADELAKWGDWKDAIWVWESVVSSRPYVTAIISNIARGYMAVGNNEKAMENLYRVKKLQPTATSVRSLEVILLSRTGKEPEALRLAKEYLQAETYDIDLINASYVLGVRAKDWRFAVHSLELRNKTWPAQAVDGWLKIGDIYASTDIKDEAKALDAYKAALAAAPEKDRLEMRTKRIPTVYQNKL